MWTTSGKLALLLVLRAQALVCACADNAVGACTAVVLALMPGLLQALKLAQKLMLGLDLRMALELAPEG